MPMPTTNFDSVTNHSIRLMFLNDNEINILISCIIKLVLNLHENWMSK